MRFGRSILSYLQLLVAATVLPFLGLVAYGYYGELEVEAAHAKAATRNLAEIAAANSRDFVARSRRYLEVLAQEPFLSAALPGCADALREFHALHPEFASLMRLDASGRVACTTLAARRPGTSVSLAGQDWFRRIRDGEPFAIGSPALSRLSERWIVVLGHAVRDAQGQFDGVIALTIDLMRYQALPAQAGLPPGTAVTLLTADGTILARSLEPEAWVGKNVRGTGMADRVLAREAGVEIDTDVDGVRRVCGFVPVPGTDWIVEAGIPSDVAFREVRARAVRLGAVLALVIAAATGLSLVIGRIIAIPVRRMADAARAVAEGNLAMRLEPGGPREVAEVAEQFNRMLNVRARTEIALGESQERLQALFDNTRDGILLVDNDARHVDANPALCALLGYAREEMLRMSLSDDVPPELQAELGELWRNFLLSGRLEGEFTCLRKDASTVEVEYRAVAHFLPGLHLCTVRDITERKRLEQRLRESEARYRGLVEQIPAIIYLAPGDKPGPALYISPQIERILGIPPSAFLGDPETWVKHRHPDDRDRVLSALSKACAAVRPFACEYRMIAGDGRTVWVRDEGNFICDETGKPVALQGIMLDITDLKRAQETRDALARERDTLLKRLKLEFERMPIGCVVTDEQFRISAWNPAAEAIFGFAREEVLGRLPYELIIPPATRGAVEETLQELRRGRATQVVVSENLTRDGRTILCEWHDTPLDDEAGNFIGMIAMAQDITDRRQGEEKLKRYAEHLKFLSHRVVEVQEDERRHLARELHDRTGQNLTALNLLLSMIREQVPAAAAAAIHPRVDDCIALVHSTVEAVRDVMSDLRPPVIEDYGLLAALHWYGGMFSQRTGLSVLVSGDEASPRLPQATETALFRIAQEAFTNVAKHANAGRVEVTLEHACDSTRLVIADDGVGFDPVNERQPAAGWGLMTMQERAEAVGGNLQVDSGGGRGTRIVVDIPIPVDFQPGDETARRRPAAARASGVPAASGSPGPAERTDCPL